LPTTVEALKLRSSAVVGFNIPKRGWDQNPTFNTATSARVRSRIYWRM